MLLPQPIQELQRPDKKLTDTTNTVATTAKLLAADKQRARDVLLQLRYTLSRSVSDIEIK